MVKNPSKHKGKSSKNSKIEDDEEFDRPEWDDEKFRHQAEEDDDEEFDRPDWDEESWFSKLKKYFLNNKFPAAAASLGVLVLVVLAIPNTRTTVLNQVGVRGTVSFVVVDQVNGLPLYDVPVTLQEMTERTDRDGLVTFENVKLGNVTYTVQTSAYESFSQDLNVNPGTNAPIDVAIKPLGREFQFEVVDELSNLPLENVVVEHEDSAAISDGSGFVSITVNEGQSGTTAFTFSLEGYLTETFDIENTSLIQSVALTIAQPHHFVNGADTNNIYKINADGSGEEIVLENAGSDLLFSVSPDNTFAAMVASTPDQAEGVRGLFIVDLSTGQATNVDESSTIQLIGWADNRIVYLKEKLAAADQDPERFSLISYSRASGNNLVLASSNVFNDVVVAQNFVFYAPSEMHKENPSPTLTRVNSDGSNPVVIFEGEVWSLTQTAYDNLAFSAGQDWYQTPIQAAQAVETEAISAPAPQLYNDNQLAQLSARVDVDGNSESLIVIDLASGEERTVVSAEGVRQPIHWLDANHIVYRVVTTDETADYIVNINGGEPLKLSDVTNVNGVNSWYFYQE